MSNRRAFTLIEVLLVLAILAVVAGMAWPALLRFAKEQEIKSAGQQVLHQLDRTRFRAIESGLLYQFLYEPQGRHFIAIPAEALPAATTASASVAGQSVAGQGVSSANAAPKYSGKLPEGLQFRPGPAAGSPVNQSSQTSPPAGGAAPGGAGGSSGQGLLGVKTLPTGALAGLANSGELSKVQWSAPILYRPDGTAGEASFRVVNESGRLIEFHVRGLTGMARVSSLKQEASP